jgi:type IV pilus assembly protein PilE
MHFRYGYEKSFFRLIEKGFTLTELIVTIAIIAILAVVAVALFNNPLVKARNAKRMSDIQAIGHAYEVNYSESSGYKPLTGQQFAGLNIPTPPGGGVYNFVYGPDTAYTCSGVKICATLEPATGVCSETSDSCYCYIGSRGPTTCNSQTQDLGSPACQAGWTELTRITGTVVNSSYTGSYPFRITRFVTPPGGYNLNDIQFVGRKGEGHPDLGCLPDAPNDNTVANPECDGLQPNEGMIIKVNDTTVHVEPDQNGVNPTFDDRWYSFSKKTNFLASSNRIEIEHDDTPGGPGSVLLDIAVCAHP